MAGCSRASSDIRLIRTAVKQPLGNQWKREVGAAVRASEMSCPTRSLALCEPHHPPPQLIYASPHLPFFHVSYPKLTHVPEQPLLLFHPLLINPPASPCLSLLMLLLSNAALLGQMIHFESMSGGRWCGDAVVSTVA